MRRPRCARNLKLFAQYMFECEHREVVVAKPVADALHRDPPMRASPCAGKVSALDSTPDLVLRDSKQKRRFMHSQRTSAV